LSDKSDLYKKISVFPIFQTVRWGETRWQWLTNASITYQMIDKAFFRFYLQIESKTGTETEKALVLEHIENLSSNFLFGYEFIPGTILYLVYNQTRNFDTESIDHIFVTKFTYSLRF
jgi:hypothetical protein